MESELKHAADEVAELAAAAKALLGIYEGKLAKVVNDLELAKNRSSDHEGQIRKTLEDIARTGRELGRQQQALVADIEQSWALKIDRNAAVAGAAQAKLFGVGIAAGLEEKLEPLAERLEVATRSYRWQSAVKWGIAVGLAVPVTIAISVWALVPRVDGVSARDVRLALDQVVPCDIGKERHVCIAVDTQPKMTGTDHEMLAVVKGM